MLNAYEIIPEQIFSFKKYIVIAKDFGEAEKLFVGYNRISKIKTIHKMEHKVVTGEELKG